VAYLFNRWVYPDYGGGAPR